MLPSANICPPPVHMCAHVWFVHVCACMCAPLSICAVCVMDEALSSILVTLAVDKPVMGYNMSVYSVSFPPWLLEY